MLLEIKNIGLLQREAPTNQAVPDLDFIRALHRFNLLRFGKLQSAIRRQSQVCILLDIVHERKLSRNTWWPFYVKCKVWLICRTTFVYQRVTRLILSLDVQTWKPFLLHPEPLSAFCRCQFPGSWFICLLSLTTNVCSNVCITLTEKPSQNADF